MAINRVLDRAPGPVKMICHHDRASWAMTMTNSISSPIVMVVMAGFQVNNFIALR
jgi:hypothetical protein